MKKLFVLAILVVLSVALLAVAGNVNSTSQTADQVTVKAPNQSGDVPLINAVERKPVQEAAPTVTSKPPENTPFTPVGDIKAEEQKASATESNDNVEPQAVEAPEPTAAQKEADAANSPIFGHQPKAEEKAPQPQSTEPQEEKWQPQYGPKGDLLNPEPTIGSILSSRGDQDLPHITETQLFFENFNGLWTGANPRPGWTVLDSGYVWDSYDWYRYSYSSWGVAFARILGSSTTQKNNDWLISPSIDLSVASTVTLNFRFYYDDNTSVPQDSGNVYLSDNGGATWNYLVRAYAGADTGTYTAPVLASYDVTSFAAGKGDIKVAFQYVRDTTASCGSFGVDNVEFVTDGGQVFFESMDSTGWGNLNSGHDWAPPDPGWTVKDNPDIWNNNDWHGYYYSTWTDTVANVYYSPVEWQNEWLITPPQDFSSNPYVHLRFKQFYDDYTGDKDTAWVWGSTDNFATKTLIDMYVGADRGSGASPDFPDYDITSWAGGQTNVQVAFKYVGNNAFYCWYIDNVEFFEPDPYEVATSAILVPPVLHSAGNWTIASRVVNHGSQTVTFQDSTYVTHEQLGTELFSEDFENGGAIPAGWTDSPGGSSQWLYDGGGTHGPGSAHGGSYAAYYNIYDYTYDVEDSLITPALDLTGGGYLLNFWSWHSSGSDSMVVYLDEGGAKTRLYRMPETSVWSLNTITLSSTYNGAKIYFIGYSRYGSNNIYIDDVSVNSPSSIVVDYVGGATVTDLAAGATMDVAYPSTWNTPAEGIYNVTQFTNLAGDADPSNDTLMGTVTVYAHTGSGGPDAGYYSFIDNTEVGGPTFNWVDMTAGTVITTTNGLYDDSYSAGIDMGGSFFYYGNTFTRLFVSTNGFLSFDTLTTSYAGNAAIPATGLPNNILPFMWDDLVSYNGGMKYLDDGTRFVVEFNNAYFYNVPATTFDAQVILNRSDNSIIMQYNNFAPGTQTDASVGIENGGGTIGLQYFHESDLGNYPYNGLAIKYFYTPPARDVAVNSILAPSGLVLNGATFTPSVVMSNAGSITEDFNAYFKIFDSTPSEVYSQSVPVTLAVGQIDTVDFPSTSITVNGAYSCSTYVDAGDPTPANDWLRSTFTVDQHFGEGGPDAGLYKWIDNTVIDPNAPVFNWVDMSGATTAPLAAGTWDDGETPGMYMGGSFFFYGQNYNAVFASTNGFVSFDSLTTSYLSNYSIPNSSNPNNLIAPMWDDMISETNGISYLDDGSRFIVQYNNIQFYGSSPNSDTIDIQIILNRADSTVIVQYRQLGTQLQTDATIGIENGTGTTGLQYYYNGNPQLNYISEGLAIKYYLFHPVLDVAMVSYDDPLTGDPGVAYYPSVTVGNNGSSATTADITVTIVGPSPATDTVFNFTETTPSLPGYTPAYSYTFGTNSWTPTVGGDYDVYTNATCAGDEIASNNDGTGSVTIAPAYDLAMVSFDAPLGGFVGTAYYPAVTLDNLGAMATTGDVTVMIIGPAPATDTVFNNTETTPSIPAHTDAYSFAFTTNSWTPSAGGAYNVITGVACAGDEDTTDNDGTGASVILFTATLDFSTDFEANNGGFVGTNDWQWGTPDYASGPPVDSIPSPVNLWGTNLTGNYRVSIISSLYSPAITLTGGVGYIAEFDMWHRLEGSTNLYDGTNLKVSTDNGAAWTVIETSLPYDGPASSGNPLYGEDVWSGYRNWTHVTVDLSAYAGETVILRFDQGSDISIVYAGTYIDDFSVTGVATDVAVNSIDSPGFLAVPGSYTITATLANPGSETVPIDSIAFVVMDTMPAVVYSDMLYDQTIDAGEAQFSSPSQWTATDIMRYSVIVTAYVAGDGIPDNNSLAAACYLQAPRAFPNVEEMTTLTDWWVFYIGSDYGLRASTSRYHSPPQSVYLATDPYPRDVWMIGPPVLITGATAPMFEFWEDQDNWGRDPDETHGADIMVDNFSFDSMIPLALWDTSHVINGFDGDSVTFDLSAYIGHVVWPILEYHVINNGSNWYFDDIGIVEGSTVTPCDYEVGDANGNGTFNGLDVTYSVAYFKGGPPPPYECECPPHGTWYVAGDVNGSCSFNGLDVTYMVAYFKGGPLPHPCPDCPPPDRILGVKSRGTSNGQ